MSSTQQIRRQLERSLELSKLKSTVGELLGVEVQAFIQRIRLVPAERAPSAGLYFRAEPSGQELCILPESSLADALLSKLLSYAPQLTLPRAELSELDRGALSALIIEAARRSGGQGYLTQASPWPRSLSSSEQIIQAEFICILAGATYGCKLWFEQAQALQSNRGAPLSALGWVPIQLPCIVGEGLLHPAQLAQLEAGDIWLPENALWINKALSGEAVLCSAESELGLKARVSHGQVSVIASPVPLALTPPADALAPPPSSQRGLQTDPSVSPPPNLKPLPDSSQKSLTPQSPSTPMSNEKAHESPILDAPLVIRVELGSIRMSARQWAELAPGDVLETNQRLSEPAVLRCGGQEIARGELVEIEGQLGIRIKQLLTGDP